MVAICALLCTAALAACGGHQAGEGAAAGATGATGAPSWTRWQPANLRATLAVAPAPRQSSRTPAHPAHLTTRERREARRLLRRLGKETARAPRSVVADSGVIP